MLNIIYDFLLIQSSLLPVIASLKKTLWAQWNMLGMGLWYLVMKGENFSLCRHHITFSFIPSVLSLENTGKVLSQVIYACQICGMHIFWTE